jgi:voltage-gated potassium channel
MRRHVERETMRTQSEMKVGIYQLFMLGLCAYVLIMLLVMTIFPLPEDVVVLLEWVDTAICLIFLADFVVNWIRRGHRYLRWGWVDLISSIPSVGWLRIGRLARAVRILRLFRGVKAFRQVWAYLLQHRAKSVAMTTLFLVIMMIIFGSIAVLEFEKQSPDASIRTPGRALWWTVVTISTVGYGDYYPVTVGGQVVASMLIVMGIGLFGVFTAVMAKWFLEQDVEEASEEEKMELDELQEQLARIEKKLGELADA